MQVVLRTRAPAHPGCKARGKAYILRYTSLEKRQQEFKTILKALANASATEKQQKRDFRSVFRCLWHAARTALSHRDGAVSVNL